MSYCRFGEGSDVYLFYSTDDEYECCGCLLKSKEGDPFGDSFNCVTASEMLAHLVEHREKGHEVPEEALVRLRGDVEAGR